MVSSLSFSSSWHPPFVILLSCQKEPGGIAQKVHHRNVIFPDGQKSETQRQSRWKQNAGIDEDGGRDQDSNA